MIIQIAPFMERRYRQLDIPYDQMNPQAYAFCCYYEEVMFGGNYAEGCV